MSTEERKIQFFKNKITARLEELRDFMPEIKYKLYKTMIDDCDSYEEIREMAEMDLQLNMIHYVNELKGKLKDNNTNLEELEAVTNKNTRASKLLVIAPKPKSQLSDAEKLANIDISTLGEDIEDEDVLASAANLLLMRIREMPPEELYREELEDYEEDTSEEDIDNLDFDEIFEETDDVFEEDTGEEDEELEFEEGALEDLEEELTEKKLDIRDIRDEEDGDEEEDVLDFGDIHDNTDEGVDIDDLDSLDEDIFTDDIEDGFEDDEEDFDIDSMDDSVLFGDCDDDSEEDSEEEEEGDIDSIDDSELFGDCEDESDDDIEDEEDGIDSIDDSDMFEESDDELFEESDSEDDIDSIEDDSDDFDIDESEFDTDEPEDDIDDFFNDLNNSTSSQQSKSINHTQKRQMAPNKIFMNNTKRGEQTQNMFNFITGLFSGTAKLATKASEGAKKAAANGMCKVNNSNYFSLDNNRR